MELLKFSLILMAIGLISYLLGRLVVTVSAALSMNSAVVNPLIFKIASSLSKVKFWAQKKSPMTNYRRVGANGVPLFGGVGIYLGVILGSFYLEDPLLYHLVLAFIPTLICGILDDIYELTAKVRLLGQILFPVFFIALTGSENLIYTKMGLPPVAGALVSGLFLVTLSNAFNFLDGIDGQVGTMSLFIFATLGFCFPSLRPLSLVLIAATAGFYVLNFPPAKIYLGEVGSSFLGMATGALTLTIPMQTTSYGTFWAINFLYGLAFCDLLMAIGRRLRKGLAPWISDREHFHHKLLAMGIHKKAVLAITSYIALASCVTGAILFYLTDPALYHAVIVLNASTLLFIFTGLAWSYKFTGKKFSHMGRTFLEKFLVFEKDFRKVNTGDCCVMIDLLPYFTELQGKGVMVVQDFVFEISEFVKNHENSKSIHLMGAYTVLMVTEDKKQIPNKTKQNFSQELYDVLLKFNVVRTMAAFPEGLKFYENLDEVALQKFGKKPEEASLRDAAA